jgi:hypothetical protein
MQPLACESLTPITPHAGYNNTLNDRRCALTYGEIYRRLPAHVTLLYDLTSTKPSRSRVQAPAVEYATSSLRVANFYNPTRWLLLYAEG